MDVKLIKNGTTTYVLIRDNDIVGNMIGVDSKINKLSLKNCQAIERGYDLENMADLYGAEIKGNVDYKLGANQGFEAGFQKALELIGDKKFSEEDIHEAYFLGEREDRDGFHNLLQSLQQTEWDVEVVMTKEEYAWAPAGEGFEDQTYRDWREVPKLDEDGCLILKRK